MKRPLTVGSFPFRPGNNPYQTLFTKALEDAGINVLRIEPEKWFPLQKIAKSKCDVLHLDWPHDWYNGKNWFTRILKSGMYRAGLRKLSQKKVVWTLHNLVAHDAVDLDFERSMIQLLIDQCDGIMVFSDSAGNQLRESYRVSPNTQIRKIYHGHYIDAYPNTVSREDARAKLKLGAEQRIFLSFGSIKPYKGHQKIISAFGNLATPNDILMIVGKGDSKTVAELRGQVASMSPDLDIRIVDDAVSEVDLQNYFNSADIAVLPFENVLNSGSMILAMSFGLPVVAPKIGSIPEIAFEKWYFGYEPDQNDETGNLEDAIHRASLAIGCSEPKQRNLEVIGFTRRHYAWTEAAMELKSWYGDLLQHDLIPGRVAT